MRHIFSRYVPVLALLGAALGTAACTDLTETPFDQITETNFNPTASDLASLIAPSYSRLRYFMGWYGYIDGQGETADILLTPPRPNGWHDGGVYIRQHEHRWTTNEGQARGVWNAAYNVIGDVNRITFQIESGVLELEDAETRADILAELRALRAFAYWMLLDNHGRVAIVTDFSDTSIPPQSTRQQVYDFVVSELTDVIPQLSQVSDQRMYGRMNEWTARAILMRTYLNAEVYTGTPDWQGVLDQSQAIIGSTRYSLDPSYRGIFSRNNHLSSEMIFAVPYDPIYGGGSNFHMKTLKPDLRFVFGLTNATPWGGSASNPQFIDTYDVDDGRLEDTWLIGPQFDSQGRGYDFVQHVPSMQGTQFHHGYPVWKYEIYDGLTGSSEVDYPIVRYAEVLMARAEALMRLGQAGAGALVTQVRQRNFTGAAAAKAVVSDADLLAGSSYNYGWYDVDGVVKQPPVAYSTNPVPGAPTTGGGDDIQFGRFLDELGWEFAAEGQRRTQLIRFGVFTTKAWFNHIPNGDHRRLFGIHTGTLNTNSNYTQNPGY